MKKYISLLMTAVLFSFVACGDDDDNKDGDGNGNGGTSTKIEAASVIEHQDASKVTHVKAVAWPNEDDDDQQTSLRSAMKMRAATRSTRAASPQVVAVSAYSNKGFKLELPNEFPSALLSDVENMAEEGFTISNKSAKVGYIDIEGHTNSSTTYSNSSLIDDFWYETEDYSWGAEYYYFTEDVTVTGSTKYGDWTWAINISAKKGWNVLYSYGDEDTKTEGITSTKPSGVTLRWVFGEEQD